MIVMKNICRFLRRALIWLVLVCLLIAQAAFAQEITISEIQKYGNLVLSVSGTELLAMGYDYGDIISVGVLDQRYSMPIGTNYTDVNTGEAICRIDIDSANGDDYAIIALNMDNFAEWAGIARKTDTESEPGYTWNYAEGVETPVSVEISMQDAGGYRDEWLLRQLVRTNERSDYPHLDDADFANFRPINTTGMGKNILYRSSSPVNPELGRSACADAAMRDAGIRTVINLADSAIAYEGWQDGYYASCSITPLGLGVDFDDPAFESGFAEGLRAIIAGEAPFLVHCNEGKDRAGFVSAVLECLMGAEPEEVIADYMVTYYNYYGVEPGTPQYAAIAESNIKKTLAIAFDVEDICADGVDLRAEAEEYLSGKLLLSEAEIKALKNKLS